MVDPRKKAKKKVRKLSKKAKMDIIKDIMADRMEDTVRRGFQKGLLEYFKEEYGVKVSHNYMSELVKECREDIDRVNKPVFAKKQYVDRYSRLLKRCKDAQDRTTEKAVLRDMATLEGHMKETHVHERGDTEAGKSIEAFFDEQMRKANEKGKLKKEGKDA